MPDLLDRVATETALDYPPVCGQCRWFLSATERVTAWGSVIPVPSRCKLRAIADWGNTRVAHNDSACNQCEVVIPF